MGSVRLLCFSTKVALDTAFFKKCQDLSLSHKIEKKVSNLNNYLSNEKRFKVYQINVNSDPSPKKLKTNKFSFSDSANYFVTITLCCFVTKSLKNNKAQTLIKITEIFMGVEFQVMSVFPNLEENIKIT